MSEPNATDEDVDRAQRFLGVDSTVNSRRALADEFARVRDDERFKAAERAWGVCQCYPCRNKAGTRAECVVCQAVTSGGP